MQNSNLPIKTCCLHPEGRIGSSLKIKKLIASTAQEHVLNLSDLEFPARSLTSIVGRSGIGKSTFLRVINRLLEEDPQWKIKADIEFLGTPIRSPKISKEMLRKCIGLILQEPCVFPFSIKKNLLFGIRSAQKLKKSEEISLTKELLHKVELWDEVKNRLGDNAEHLSVGQKQRLCIARSLALNPEILLMDEPTSSLDPETTFKIEELIQNLSKERCIILVTHNREQVSRLEGRVLEFYRGDQSSGTMARELRDEKAKLNRALTITKEAETFIYA
ncbi:MAG: phosphate ABC transporter ATP-binding protein [Deltaproteobacteria bacterium CG11_big_fil_rev_8_21_14_0_20_45_16]|nr:MAG: phosphate ABC transporter ATP-binding protein [Deltaproteobacteria bacterium CG11_big_fil_rev_8_21_14_0_20_45_16]